MEIFLAIYQMAPTTLYEFLELVGPHTENQARLWLTARVGVRRHDIRFHFLHPSTIVIIVTTLTVFLEIRLLTSFLSPLALYRGHSDHFAQPKPLLLSEFEKGMT